ncbi:MAG: HEAT repeat domain-containing protein, partial [Lacipirellulaceae bacterium]
MSTNLPSEPSQGDRTNPEGPIAADDLLPPVEPPNAKFIIQLFVTPMVIVASVVGIWLLLQWLANSGDTDPDKIVAALRSSNQARFQQAAELSHMLQAEGRYPELKTNRELVKKLAELLLQQVDEKREGEGDVTMRTFLTRSLGEFHVDDGLPALIATAERDQQRGVRRDAINAIAVLATNVPDLDRPELVELMRDLADSDDELFRSEAAFALGVLAESPSASTDYRDLLALLAEDFYPDARYNAGVGLARCGDLRAVPVLQEMLDLNALVASVDSEKGVGDPN